MSVSGGGQTADRRVSDSPGQGTNGLVRTLIRRDNVEVDGDGTVVVGLIGAGIGMSLSPALHEREAALLGVDYEYRLFDLDELGRPASDVGALVREARADGLRGLNVTHPCKQLVVAELDDLSPEAAALGAVNTIVFEDGGMVGPQHGRERLPGGVRAPPARRAHGPCRAARRGRGGCGGRPRDQGPRRTAADHRRRRARARRSAGAHARRGRGPPRGARARSSPTQTG